MNDERRQRLKQQLRERIAQTPKGSREWAELTHTLFQLALHTPVSDIHKFNRRKRDAWAEE